MENDQLKSQDKLTSEVNQDKINVHQLIEFLEYEEALTKDPTTAGRIRILLKLMGIWN
jgi:hypothetical protein